MMRKFCLTLFLVPVLAWAEPRSAAEWYHEGENQYNLGNFDRAVDAFKQGFSLETDNSKKAAYLYNVAQSYRQANDCKNALFFYKRFIALKDHDADRSLSPKMRKDINGWIREAEVCVQHATALSKKLPSNNLSPDGDGGTGGRGAGGAAASGGGKSLPSGDDDGEQGDSSSSARPARFGGPYTISARLIGGGTKVTLGKIDVPVQVTLALVGGYPIAVSDRLTIDAGAAFTYTPVPYIGNSPGSSMAQSGTAQLVGIVANAGATYEVVPNLGLRGDVGLGALFFSNVSESPFTGGAPTSGTLAMFHLRGALSADYAVTSSIVVTATPFAYSYSPPKAGLSMDISAVTSIDFMIGIGYRM